MDEVDDFVQVGSGRFITRKHYVQLTNVLGIKHEDIVSFLDEKKRIQKIIPSMVNKPLLFQEKLGEGSS